MTKQTTAEKNQEHYHNAMEEVRMLRMQLSAADAKLALAQKKIEELEALPVMNFRPIAEAPEYKPGTINMDILCRFWYPHGNGHWIYFTAQPNGKDTRNPNFAPPEEFFIPPEMPKAY